MAEVSPDLPGLLGVWKLPQWSSALVAEVSSAIFKEGRLAELPQWSSALVAEVSGLDDDDLFAGVLAAMELGLGGRGETATTLASAPLEAGRNGARPWWPR